MGLETNLEKQNMPSVYLDVFSAFFAVVSAVLWGLSAFVDFPFGFDMDRELSAAMKKSARLNAFAASAAALSALSQAAKIF